MAENNTEPSCPYPTCGCVGYAYVPEQKLNNLYCESVAFEQGTIFPELDLDIKEYGKVCKMWGGVRNGCEE